MTTFSRTRPERRRAARRAPAAAAPAPDRTARRRPSRRAAAPLLALLAVPVAIAALSGPAAAAPFGADAVGGDGWNTLSVDKKRAALYTLDADARVSGLSAYLDGNGPGSGAQATRAVIYADRSGAPGALVASSAEVVIAEGRAAGWVGYALSTPIDLEEGDYWLGILASGPGQVGRFDYAAVPGSLLYNADGYSDGAAASFGTSLTPSASRITIRADLERATHVTFGAQRVQGDGWNTLSTDKKRATSFTLASAGALESLSAHLDGNGPGSGTQSTRAVVYADRAGAPGALVATSAEVVIAKGRAAGWVEYRVTDGPTLAPGAYWLGIISSGPAQVGRFDHGSVPGDLLYNADAYSDGAAPDFGAPLAPSASSMTINATVRPQAATELSVAWPGAAGATVSGQTPIDASVSGAGVAEVRYLVDGRVVGSDGAAPYTHLLDTTAIAAGPHTVTVEARTGAGAVLASDERGFVVSDTLAPLLTLSGLAEGAVAAGTVGLEAAAGDVSGVDRVEFLLDDRLIASRSAAPFAASFDADLLAHGAHRIRVRAVDPSGNAAVVDRAFTVSDGDGPTLGLSGIAEGASLTEPAAVTVDAGDRSGVTRVAFLLDGVPVGTDTEAPYTQTVAIPTLAHGVHVLRAEATDGAGNVARLDRAFSVVDEDLPALSIDAPADGATISGQVAIAASAADRSGITSVRLLVDGVLAGADAEAPFAHTLDADALADGPHEIAVVARDGAGNERTITRTWHLADRATVAPVTFGAAAPAGDGWNTLSTDKKRASRYALASTGDLVRLSAFLDGNGPGSGTQATRAVIYADQGGLPGALVGTSDAVTITAGRAAGWVDYAMPRAVRLGPGDYWIGILAAGPEQVGRFDYSTVPGGLLYNADAFSDGAAPGFGAPLAPSASRITMRAHLQAPGGDVVAPTVTIDSPAEGQTFQAGGSVTITAGADDPSGIASVVFSIDGAELATDASAPYSASWDLAGVSPGMHTISVRATDTASNTTTASRTVTIDPVLSGALPGTRLFTGDWETGDLSQYAGAQVGQNTTGRVTAVTSPRVQGGYAGRFEVRAGDDFNGGGSNRAEVMLKVANEVEGDERWYDWSSMFAAGYPKVTTGHQIFTQWHATAGGTQPMLVFYASGDTIGFKTVASSWNGSRFVSQPSVVHWSGPMNRGAWHNFRIHVKWSSKPAVGYVELWRNGAKVVQRKFLATLIAGQDAYLKQGMYRNAGADYTSVVFTDGLVINRAG